MLVDNAVIYVCSGKGGSGCISFLRMKNRAKGGPNGGGGGEGGDMVVEANPNVNTLMDYASKHHWYAQKGGSGRGKQQHGANGNDCVLLVPPGTLVYNDETGELFADLMEIGDRVVVGKGGRGGFGNEHFKSSTNQVPRECTPGEPAEELKLRFELKLIADVGLVGLPNAGKSTLLSVLSKATPKIADYPFTTLEPNLGIAELAGASGDFTRRVIFADIPGLIGGASQGQGLGHEFLKHVERTRLLVHLLDVDPIDHSSPVENFHVIRKEIEAYSPELAVKQVIIVLSKMDLFPNEEDRQTAIDMIQQELGFDVMCISSATRQGVNELVNLCWEKVQKIKQMEETCQ
ncbi:MAG: GTPase ObgE, partial [Phycisphaeraceae bacterium]|nr:GTPase ObgE [Phycisphaeraceae bacterium]